MRDDFVLCIVQWKIRSLEHRIEGIPQHYGNFKRIHFAKSDELVAIFGSIGTM